MVEPDSDTIHPALSGRLIALMAVAIGAIAANLYYAQPLLHQLSRDFGAGAGATSLIVTATQAGYAASLILVLPLGDIHPRRGLVAGVFAVAVGALVLCSLAPSLWVFEMASVLVGLASVAGQVMVPFGADLAAPARRGRVVARLMSGLLVGVLLARTLSGLVAQFAGWRAVYWVSAGIMALLALVLWRALPGEPARPRLPYGRLVAAPWRLLAAQPQLRRRAWYGAMVFGAFSVLWTSLAFLLSGGPWHYSELVIGLFGLAGVAGVAAANLAGKLADAAHSAWTTTVAAVLTAGAFGLLYAGRSSLALLVAGIVVLDIGAQSMHITNQSIIYEIAPEARSSVNSAYMTCYFAGGAVGSVAAGSLYESVGWAGVCAVGAGFGTLALALAAFERLSGAPRTSPAPLPQVAALPARAPGTGEPRP